MLHILIVESTPIFLWIRKHIQVWTAGELGRGLVAVSEKGDDFVPSCEIVIPEGVGLARFRTCMIVNVVCTSQAS